MPFDRHCAMGSLIWQKSVDWAKFYELSPNMLVWSQFVQKMSVVGELWSKMPFYGIKTFFHQRGLSGFFKFIYGPPTSQYLFLHLQWMFFFLQKKLFYYFCTDMNFKMKPFWKKSMQLWSAWAIRKSFKSQMKIHETWKKNVSIHFSKLFFIFSAFNCPWGYGSNWCLVCDVGSSKIKRIVWCTIKTVFVQ